MLKFNCAFTLGGYTLCLIAPFCYADVYFNPAFLSGDEGAVADLTYFSSGATQKPGLYKVDVFINDILIGKQSVNFIKLNNKNNVLTPTFKVKDLEKLGVNVKSIVNVDNLPPEKDLIIEEVIPGAISESDFNHLVLKITLPQASLLQNARGYIPSTQWDQGINALLLNYSLSGNKDWHETGSNESQFLGLQSGANFGAWRLRDNSSLTRNTSSQSSSQEWQHISTYIQRNIESIKGELTMGDTNTGGGLYDSIPFRGITIESDENMLPDSQKGFAPTIRGIAKSNAKVTIKQNGYTLYQTYVSPGAFEINDLFPTSTSGDLQVTIAETDGTSQTFTTPYSSVPGLQREGHINYSTAAGQYHSGNSNQDTPSFIQGTIYYGAPYGYTFYGGAQFSDQYKSLSLGVGKGLGELGALSLDITSAASILSDDSHHSGASARFMYAKSLNATGTTFNLMGYRYSTEGFYTLSDTTYKNMKGYNDPVDEDEDEDEDEDYANYYDLRKTKRGRFQLSINQTFGAYGSFYISGSQQTYWRTGGKDTYIQSGYNTSIGDVALGISYSYNKYADQPVPDKIISMNFSLPIGKWLSPTDAITSHQNNAYLTYNNSQNSDGHLTQNVGVSGSLLDDNNLTYSVQKNIDNENSSSQGSVNGNYRGTYNNFSLGYSHDSNSHQVNYGISGGIIAHSEGVTFSQPLGDTNILVAAPGAKGIGIENNTGVKTDWRGYAVVPYASTYHYNRVALNTDNLGKDVALDSSVVSVVPTKGAVVRADFDPKVGIRALLTITKQGKPLPFGALVTLDSDKNSSIVGDEGQVYLTGLPLSGKLSARWGNNDSQSCTAIYKIPEKDSNMNVVSLTTNCQ
ncbi:fimbrial biogenesis usher protein [Buttiauxella agrestis]|uniref:fimbrial biogenesis usher protein n=1 Tax=Buttiauxella agrestis TaxID=82977 RepID=UPI003976121E